MLLEYSRLSINNLNIFINILIIIIIHHYF